MKEDNHGPTNIKEYNYLGGMVILFVVLTHSTS